MVVSLAINAYMRTLFAATIVGCFGTTLAQIERPANRLILLIKLAIPFELLRASGFGFCSSFGSLLGLERPGTAWRPSFLIFVAWSHCGFGMRGR